MDRALSPPTSFFHGDLTGTRAGNGVIIFTMVLGLAGYIKNLRTCTYSGLTLDCEKDTVR